MNRSSLVETIEMNPTDNNILDELSQNNNTY